MEILFQSANNCFVGIRLEASPYGFPATGHPGTFQRRVLPPRLTAENGWCEKRQDGTCLIYCNPFSCARTGDGVALCLAGWWHFCRLLAIRRGLRSAFHLVKRLESRVEALLAQRTVDKRGTARAP
eukprot:1189559-Prorocentrum_minimum.AAC.2